MIPLARLPDRAAAGRLLAERLVQRPLPAPLVLALPRGGVPVALEIARALHAPLDLLLVRKIGWPGQPELAAAALAEGDPPRLLEAIDRPVGLDARWLAAQVQQAAAELTRRQRLYRGDRPRVPVAGRSVVLVDDGLATGTSAEAALRTLRDEGPARLLLAVPVAPADTLARLAALADTVVCLHVPEPFHAVGQHYDDFHQLDDDEVLACLRAAGPAR